MKNQELAKIFYEIAEILEMKDVQWKPRAYRKAATSLDNLKEDITKIYKQGGIDALEKIHGVGERIAKKIVEYIKTGKVKTYERLRKQQPRGLTDLMKIGGLGPRKIEFLYKKLGIKTVKQLESAVKKHQLKDLPGFREKTEQNLLESLGLFKRSKERSLLNKALLVGEEILTILRKSKYITKAELAGSSRRRKETIGDLDILATSKHPKKVMDLFTSMKNVSRILSKGKTKSIVILKNDMQADLRVVDPKSFGSAMQYFTGNKDHNVKLRTIAISKGYKLSEYGLFSRKTGKQVAGKTEQEVYKKLGLDYIPPELRENIGEIQAAQKGKLPKLITLKDIKGDLQMHTNYSDGANTIREMALAAKKLGYTYIAITDHSKSQRIANGMDEKKLLKYIKEVKQVNKSLKGIKVLVGAEVDILANGSLDYSDEYLKKLDIVIAAIHSGFKQPKEKITQRVLNALDNKYVNILAHPTGRKINTRSPINIDMTKLFNKALDTKTILEINAQPLRLDLNDKYTREAKELGIKMVISSDAHSTDQLNFMPLGVYTARRGWAEKKDIVNTWSFEKLKKFL